MGLVDATKRRSWCCAIRATSSRRSHCRLQDAFELPPDAAARYIVHGALGKTMLVSPAIVLQAQQAHEFHLAPFQVLTLDILPGQSAQRERRMDAMVSSDTSCSRRRHGQPLWRIEAV